MDNVTELYNLSSEKNGASIIFSSDDTFGVAENLLKETTPLLKKKLDMSDSHYADAWLTKRERTQKLNFAIIKLAATAEIYFICVDTSLLFRNVALQFSIQAAKLLEKHNDPAFYQNRIDKINEQATKQDWRRIEKLDSENWLHLIEAQSLSPGYQSMNKKFFMLTPNGKNFTHLRLNIFPDGGISRLRVYGKVSKPIPMSSRNFQIDLVSKIYGGKCVAYSNYYNHKHPNNLIKPVESKSVNDGWHTPRNSARSTAGFLDHLPLMKRTNQISGEEWVVFQLGYSGTITSIVIDTKWCIWNAPYVVRVQGIKEGISLDVISDLNALPWQDIIPYTLVTAGCKQEIASQRCDTKMAYVKLSIKPDGCISRFRVLGQL